MQRITELFYGMKLFDVSGNYQGRVCELDDANQTFTYLTPTMGTTTYTLAKAKELTLYCDASDQAIVQRWKRESDVPPDKPGLTFQDGLVLGKREASDLNDLAEEPPDWLYEEEELYMLSGDEFHDGFVSGARSEHRRLLLLKFPPEVYASKMPSRTKWSIDQADPEAVASYEAGVKLAQEQNAWLRQLQMERLVHSVIEEAINKQARPPQVIPFRHGFKTEMERRFPYRY